ncbi:MAG: peroxiredoxin family protein [Saprospiraceae bacterium]
MYLLRKLCYLFIFLNCSVTLLAQPNAIVRGKLDNVDFVKEISIYVNQRYVDGNFITYTSKVLDDGTFALALDMVQPQLVTMTYAQNSRVFYIEPNDSLYVNADAQSFPYTFKFSGRGAANNRFLTEYFKENPIDATPFTQVQYKKGVYWYSVNQETDRLMQQNKPENFKKKLDLRKASAYLELDNYSDPDDIKITPEFRDFMTTDILYYYAYHMLLYANVYKNVHGIPNTFVDFMTEIPLQNSQIGSHWYREYLLAYLNHKVMEQNGNQSSHNQIFAEADKQLGSVALAFVQSEMIAKQLLKNTKATIPTYLEFLENNPYLEFDEKIMTAYQKARLTSVGTTAPDFSMNSADGNIVSLSDYRGKIVYLNFWASWCRPCMNKMIEMRDAQNELEEDGIVVLNISFDRKKETWKNTIESRDFGGIHLYAEGNIDSDIATLYDIDAIPQYFIINKRGQFATKPKKYTISEIQSALRELTQ